MPKSFESHIAVYEDIRWRGASLGKSYPLYVDSESFDTGKQITNNNNLIRDGRVNKIDSQVSGPIKPEGGVVFQPRSDDINPVLYSHFQYLVEAGTGPYTYTYVPSKFPVIFSNSGASTEGTYGANPKAAYSVSFLKKYLDTTEYGGTNAILFQHGICDSLTFNLSSGGDFSLDCNYKFRDLTDGTAISSNPTGTAYSQRAPFEWYHGTVTVNGVDFGLESIRNIRLPKGWHGADRLYV